VISLDLNYEEIRNCLKKEPRIIRLPEKGKAVFVGDTHGDVETTEEVLNRYFKPGYTLVFLGDYVDRGRSSRENISLLLARKLQAPDRLHLLMGNHEGYCFREFSPADFWEGLSKVERAGFGGICGLLPYIAVSSNGILALHGAPPALSLPGGLNGLEKIVPGSKAWQSLVWGDFTDSPNRGRVGHALGRPRYDRTYFDSVMNQYGKKVLIRSHQLDMPETVFDKRCLTIMSSKALDCLRRIAVVDLERSDIASVSELKVLPPG
jgi:protein phosphatase